MFGLLVVDSTLDYTWNLHMESTHTGHMPNDQLYTWIESRYVKKSAQNW